jgi:hypothetical protein
MVSGRAAIRIIDPRAKSPYNDPVRLPKPECYRPEPDYMRTLVERSGMSQRRCARLLCVDERTMRGWILGERSFPYSAQFTMEALADAGAKQSKTKRQRKRI